MDNKAFKAARLQSFEGLKLNENTYNLVIGLVLLWGIMINVVMSNFFMTQIMMIPPIAVLIIYLAGSIGCMLVIYKSDVPVVSFLGFTGLSIAMGLLVTYYISYFTKETVTRAFLMTAMVTLVMILISSIKPAFFLSIGRALIIALIATIVIEVLAALIFKSSMVITDYIVALIFCGFIGYDWAKAQVYPKTLDNAIDSAADIYVDVVNLFIRILSIMGKKNN